MKRLLLIFLNFVLIRLTGEERFKCDHVLLLRTGAWVKDSQHRKSIGFSCNRAGAHFGRHRTYKDMGETKCAEYQLSELSRNNGKNSRSGTGRKSTTSLNKMQ